ncbi:MAG: bifunctional diguanylate cyclase/phosphodiesterase [Clostridiales bacterium]|nr:bifunctional diguanylate cyclase/phosphodiesterase [Clostridiales bacterium]
MSRFDCIKRQIIRASALFLLILQPTFLIGASADPASGESLATVPSDSVLLGLIFSLLTMTVISCVLMIKFIGENKRLKNAQNDLLRSKEELFESAYKDTLTGLPNRSHFYLRLAELSRDSDMDATMKDDKPVNPFREVDIVYIDVDDFKLINESRGHQAGDALLKMIAAALSKLSRDHSDVYVSRIGGDEFVVMLENPASRKTTEEVTAAIQEIFNRKYCVGECNIYPTASIGIARFPQDAENMFDLMTNADMALYEAKRDGKNRFIFYNPSMNEMMKQMTHIQNMVLEALSEDQLYLLYQPQIDYAKHKLVGYEALIRWMDPLEGMIMPGHFIPIIEKTGQILSIGKWVLEKACIFARKVNEKSEEDIIISVNISAVQLIQKDFFDSVVDIVGKTDVRPSLIGLEITETAMITSLKQNADVLSRLQQMGFHVYLDDFGTGYSSIHYLRELPIETVKIDQTFVSAVGESEDDDDLLRLIIHIAHLMKINVMAEGVETMEQLNFLEENHCDTCQGFLFSMPITEEEILSGNVVTDLKYRR